ncbi:MAG: sigma-54-dependent transcriptional regulator [Bryobacteraceae bacterium]
MITVVAIDDDPASLELVQTIVERDEVTFFGAGTAGEGLELIRQHHPQLVLLDLVLPDLGGMEVLERIVDFDPGAEVMLLTAHYSTQSAVEAIQKGASDYLTKPLNVEELTRRLDQMLEESRRRRETLRLDRELMNAFQFEGIVGRSPIMLDLYTRIRRVAPHFRTVLVAGPTGSGKELVARALHRLSPAARGNFVACNCSAIVETLMESELFGHVAGAFTGATKDKTGLFEQAHRGTLFLDEIGDMPLATQAKLLRVLQNQEFQKVGSPVTRQVDVRVVAATHRDLRAMAERGQFREDLYYRLSMMELLVPSLASRKEDLPLLERFFVERFASEYGKTIRGLTRRAQAVLAQYGWPGNVRELENVLGNACMMADSPIIDVRDLPTRVRAPEASAAGGALITLEEAQHRHALRVVEALGGNKVQAAEVLGVSRATLYRLLGWSAAKGGRAGEAASASTGG